MSGATEEDGADPFADLDWMALANRRAKGRRPAPLAGPADAQHHGEHLDTLMAIVTALVAELSVVRQRLDTVERLLEAGGALSREAIEGYAPDPDAARERGLMIREYIHRVMRGPDQRAQELAADDRPIEEVSRALREM